MIRKTIYKYNFHFKGSDGTVSFPEYVRYISAQKISPVSVPYSRNLLRSLLLFVERLTLSAKNHHGQPQSEQINDKTIFVNPLVKLAQNSSLAGDNKQLVQLYKLASELQIKPLINLFASYIVDRIYPLTTSLSIAIEESLLNVENPLPNSEYIAKHLQLKRLGMSELTIRDYLALYGQPKIVNEKLDLSRENLTSLHGIDLIANPGEVKELIIENNFLTFNESVTVSEYLQPFSNLKKMSLRGNQPSNLPLNSFHNVQNVQLIL